MSKEVDERVVEMRFNNALFESKVQQTMRSLAALNEKLMFKGAEKGFEKVSDSSEKVKFNALLNALDNLSQKFSAVEVIGVTALMRITNQAVDAGERLVKALSLDPIISGFQEYETQINAVQTILANTSSKGTTLDQVNAALDELNHYADLTIYNFTEMTRNIGTFTAAGVDLNSLSGGRADITEGSNIYELWKYVFSTRSSKNYEDGDNTRGEALSLYVQHGRGADPGSPGYINTYWDTTTGQWGVSSSNILVCFCVDENATVDDDGCLTANSGPEIQSNYFGMNGVFGRWGKFGLPYRVYDADGDTITVTEKLNGKVRRTFRAIQNGVYRFEISQKELESFDWNADYILTVEASDGRTTNRKSCKVNRIRSSGYVVYIGQIKGTADGQSYYWTERNILDDPFNENAPVILDPEVTLEANEISSFTFTVPVSNPFYDKLELKKPVVSIEEDGREIFMGYITEMEKNFELDMEVTCESEFGYLQDRDCRVENKFYTAAELLTLALTVEDDPEEHVGFKGEGKVFLPGNVTIEKPESDTDKETKAISDCWSVLTNSLTGKYGGYLRLRKEIKMVDGVRVYTRYLDYLAKLNDKTDQVIELGKNLLDISYYIKAGDIVNSVKAYGWYKSGWFLWETTNPISREAYNGESIKKYGLCQRVLVVEGTDSTEDSLLKKATDELKKYSGFTGSVQINAADLCDIGVDTDRLDFMKETFVLSEPHGIDDWLPCTKEVIPLHVLDQKDFTFGATTAKLSSLQAGNFATAGKAWNAIQSTIGYINK